MKRAYLCIVAYDPDFLGWHFPGHEEVIAQGGSWGMICYWTGEPKEPGQIDKTYNACALVDVPNHDQLVANVDNIYSFNLDFATKDDFMNFIQANSPAILPQPIKNDLRKAGFDTGAATIYAMIQDILVQ